MRCHIVVVVALALIMSSFTLAKSKIPPISSRPTFRGYINSSEERASSIMTHTLEELLQKGKPPNQAFKLQGLHMAGDDVLTSPVLATWMKYLEYYNNKNSRNQASLFATLLTYYGDVGVARIIVAGRKKDVRTKKIAGMLHKELIRHWLNSEKMWNQGKIISNGKHPDKVFELLELDQAGEFLLDNPLLTMWIMYVDAFNTYKRKHFFLCESLIGHFGEEKLVKMLYGEESESSPNTRLVANVVRTNLFQYWMLEEKHPNDIFLLMELDKVGPLTLAENPRFLGWMNYVDEWRAKYPAKRLNIIEILAQTYADPVLVNIIYTTSRKPRTKVIAEKLKFLLFQRWMMQYETEAVKTTYERLKLHLAGNTLFQNPAFIVWIEFVFYRASVLRRLTNTELIASLKKVLKNGSDRPVRSKSSWVKSRLVDALITAKSVPGTEEKAAHVLSDFMEQLLQAQTRPTKVFRIVRANEGAEREALYEAYATAFRNKYGNKRKRARTS